jgi:hypothetical protein
MQVKVDGLDAEVNGRPCLMAAEIPLPDGTFDLISQEWLPLTIIPQPIINDPMIIEFFNEKWILKGVSVDQDGDVWYNQAIREIL